MSTKFLNVECSDCLFSTKLTLEVNLLILPFSISLECLNIRPYWCDTLEMYNQLSYITLYHLLAYYMQFK